jgi:uncharacterized lipoprotein YbaY
MTTKYKNPDFDCLIRKKFSLPPTAVLKLTILFVS